LDAIFCSRCGTELDPSRESAAKVRQIASVLFTDVADSTSLIEELDANAAEIILNRFFQESEKAVTRYGGVLQNRIGDEVMALFGVPRPFGDDALRAVLAALDLHEAIATLNTQLRSDYRVELRLRTAVHTGSLEVAEVSPVRVEVVTPLTTLGKRLQAVAQPGQTLISQATYQLVRDVVRADPIGPVQLKGIKGPLQALRVVGLRARIPTATPMIGRGQELALLTWAYDWVVSQKRCYLVHVLGEAGVGKTRLVEEYARRIGSRPRTGRVQPQMLRGQCQPYGSYITYHPFRQILRQAAEITRDDSAEEARSKLSAMVEGDRSVIARLESLMGLTENPGEPEDSFRALQRALSIMAQRSPLVLIIDDLQWAQPPLLELIDQLGRALAGVSILIVCISRLELLDEPRTVDGPNVAFLRVPPLTRPETEQLVAYLLPAGGLDPTLIGQICEATEGYPFDVEELARNLIEEGHLQLVDGRWTLQDTGDGLRVTPTVQTALAARLGRLDEEERLIVVRAAVIGLEFHRAEVEALMPGMAREVVTRALQELIRKELLQQVELKDRAPLEASDPPDEAYRFRHVRYREAAYQRITPQDRADLHQRYADWLERQAEVRATAAERIAYHLEQAYRYRLKQHRNEPDETTLELARRAGLHYAAAGRAYIPKGILPIQTAVGALERAIELLPAGHPARLRAQLDLAEVLEMTDPARSMQLYEEVFETAGTAEYRLTQLHAELGKMELGWFRSYTGDWQLDQRRIEQIIAELEPNGDALLLARAWRLVAQLDHTRALANDGLEACGKALELARRAGDERLQVKITQLNLYVLYWSPASLNEVEHAADQTVAEARNRGLYGLEAGGLGVLARVAALRGRFPEARQLLQRASRVLPESPDLLMIGNDVLSEAIVELAAGDLERAGQVLERGLEEANHGIVGSRSQIAHIASLLARTRLLQGREADAERAVEIAERASVASEISAQTRWRQVKALLLARRGGLEAAGKLVQEAVDRSRGTQSPDIQAQALADLAEVLRLAGDREHAAEAADHALELYRQRGDKVHEQHAMDFLTRLGVAR
jgi:class 3 adenylate cyclase